MEIKILGPGCPKCKTLEKMTKEVIEKEGINAVGASGKSIQKVCSLLKRSIEPSITP